MTMALFKKKKPDLLLLDYCPQCDTFTKRGEAGGECFFCSSLSTYGLLMQYAPNMSKEDADKLWEMGLDDTQTILASEWDKLNSTEKESRLNAARDIAISFLNLLDDVKSKSEQDNLI